MTDSVHEATKIRSPRFQREDSRNRKGVVVRCDRSRRNGRTLRVSVEQRLETARQRLRKLEEVAMDATSAAARATDEFVYENPWQTIGVAASLGAALGVAIGMLVSRR